jgi:hypothetical protein
MSLCDAEALAASEKLLDAALPPLSRCAAAEPLGERLCPLITEEGFGASGRAGMVADWRGKKNESS